MTIGKDGVLCDISKEPDEEELCEMSPDSKIEFLEATKKILLEMLVNMVVVADRVVDIERQKLLDGQDLPLHVEELALALDEIMKWRGVEDDICGQYT